MKLISLKISQDKDYYYRIATGNKTWVHHWDPTMKQLWSENSASAWQEVISDCGFNFFGAISNQNVSQ